MCLHKLENTLSNEQRAGGYEILEFLKSYEPCLCACRIFIKLLSDIP